MFRIASGLSAVTIEDGGGEVETNWIIAYKNGKCGVINYSNEILISLEYDSIIYSDVEDCFVLGKGTVLPQ